MLRLTPEVDWYMEKLPNGPSSNADMCIAATMAKNVSRNDQAFFKDVECLTNAIVVLDNEAMDRDRPLVPFVPFKLMLMGAMDSDKLTDYFGDKKHAVFKLSTHTLVPVSDIEAKLEKDVQDKRKAIEKTMRRAVVVGSQKSEVVKP